MIGADCPNCGRSGSLSGTDNARIMACQHIDCRVARFERGYE